MEAIFQSSKMTIPPLFKMAGWSGKNLETTWQSVFASGFAQSREN